MSELIAPTAVISEASTLADDVRVGHCSIVYDNVELQAGCVVEDFCVIGSPTSNTPLVIGAESHIRSHSVIYDGSTFGQQFQTGHHALVRSGCVAGTNFRLGSYSAVEPDVTIGEYVRVHGYSQIGQGTTVGDFVWVYSLVTITNDPLPPSHTLRPAHIGSGAVICVNATVLPGTDIGLGAFIVATAKVSGVVPAGSVIDEQGEVAGPITMLIDPESGTRHPWMRHFADAYPASVSLQLTNLQDEVLTSAKSVPRFAEPKHEQRDG